MKGPSGKAASLQAQFSNLNTTSQCPSGRSSVPRRGGLWTRAAGLAYGSSTLTCSLRLRGFPCWAWSPCSAIRFLLPAL